MARYALIIAAAVGFLVTAAATNLLLPALQRIRIRRLEPPRAGRVLDPRRAGAPSMGGVAVMLGTFAAVGAAWLGLRVLDGSLLDGHQRMNLMLALAGAFGFAVVGFLDDHRRELLGRSGLRDWQRLLLQALVTVCFLAGLYYTGSLDTGMVVPFVGYVDFGAAYYPVSFVLILAVVQGADIAGQADGVCCLAAFLSMLGLVVVCGFLNCFQLAINAAALAGALLAFLMWAFPPARITLGRTGSSFLGGSLAAVAFCLGWPSLLILLACVYLLELLCSVLQLVWFRLTKKLLLRMAPLHEAMRCAGWSPLRITATFGGAAGVCMLLAMLFVRLS